MKRHTLKEVHTQKLWEGAAPLACPGSSFKKGFPGRRRQYLAVNGGFTLGEMVIVIAIIAILAALIAPLAVNVISQGRMDACREELVIIKKAIVGDAVLQNAGARSNFGFVGDVGILPRDNLTVLGFGANLNNTLEDLLSQNALPAYPQSSNNVTWGWRGPYLNEDKDPWGRRYYYDVYWPAVANPTFANLPAVLASIWSAGPDGVNNNGVAASDDIIINIRTDEVYAMASGNTLDNCGAGKGFRISIYVPNGTAALTRINIENTNASPFYNLPNFLPIGARGIEYRFTTDNYTDAARYTDLFFINNGPVILINFREAGACPHL